MRKKPLLPIDINIDYSTPFNLSSIKSTRSSKRVPLRKTEHFHKNKKQIPRTIKSKIDDHEIVYGARALNKRFPSFLDTPTTDYDIYTPYPKRDARETERALDKKFGGDYFFVEPAQHPGTVRVRSHVDGEVYADYTKPEEPVPSERIDGVRYVKLTYVKKRIHKILDDPSASYRHNQDKDALNRIKIYEKMKKRK